MKYRISNFTPVICLIVILATILPQRAAAKEEPASSPSRIEQVEKTIQPMVHISGTPDKQSLNERMHFYNTPGVSIAVIEHGKLAWSKGYGVLSAKSREPVTDQTLFEAASISKPITALTAMLLAQHATFDINKPIDLYLKSWHFPPGASNPKIEPTARQIMCHHGGINVESVSGHIIDPAKTSSSLPTLNQILNGEPPANTPAVKVINAPGKAFQYSGGGYLVLQQALIDTSGEPLEHLAESTLFKPLAMDHSTFEQPPEAGLKKLVAQGHGYDGSPMPWRLYPELAAAGLRTTPSDLSRVIIQIQEALKGRSKILSKQSAEQILTVQDKSPTVGLGVFLSGTALDRRFSMDGWNYGFTCRMVGYPERGEGAVVMTNGESGALMFEILDTIAKAYAWPGPPAHAKEAVTISEAEARKYTGRYKWDEEEEAEILRLGSRIFLHVSHNDKNQMDPFPPAEIFARDQSEMFTLFPAIRLQFHANKEGNITEFIYHQGGKPQTAQRLL